ESNSKLRNFPLRETERTKKKKKKMEAIVLLTTGEMKNIKVNGEVEKERKIFRIQVSKTKKPLFFYLNLAKKQLKTDNDVELCALGTGIVASTIEAKEDKEGRVGAPKAKLDILLGKAKTVDQSTDGSA
ncbi:hypothetical protein KIW84_025545, partial [Lathyrus oleraceus]